MSNTIPRPTGKRLASNAGRGAKLNIIMKAIFKLPPIQLETRKVFVGSYGGHYSVVVIFREKPELKDEFISYDKKGKAIKQACVGLTEESDNSNIIGAMYMEEFRKYFPKSGIKNPSEIKVIKTIEVELTAPFDEDGKLSQDIFPNFNAERWTD